MKDTVAAETKKSGWKPLGMALVALVIAAAFLNARANSYAGIASANEALLNAALPDFSEGSVAALSAGVEESAARVAALAALFDPREKWVRPNYDPSILFAEELNRANTDLKALAQENQITFSGFSFADKLPSESDAGILLGQLYGMRLVAQLALNLGADISLAKPLPVPKEQENPSARALPAEFEMAFPHETVMDFLIRFNGIVPKLCGSSLKARADEESVYVSLRYSTLRLDTPMPNAPRGTRITAATVPDESYPAGIEGAVALLRSKSPFTPPVKQVAAAEEEEPPAEVKPAQRFFYKGRAVLRNKNVALIEDTMRNETLFLSTGDRFDVFRLKEFSDTQAVLEGSENFLTVIKREDL